MTGGCRRGGERHRKAQQMQETATETPERGFCEQRRRRSFCNTDEEEEEERAQTETLEKRDGVTLLTDFVRRQLRLVHASTTPRHPPGEPR